VTENVLVEIGSTDNHKDLNAALVGLSPGNEGPLSPTARTTSREPARQDGGLQRDPQGRETKVVPAADDRVRQGPGRVRLPFRAAGQDPRQLKEADEHKIDRDAKNAVLEALVQRAGFEVPDALIGART